jgi:DNA repair exonuclease SbcCD ATPase subunit
MNDDRRLEDVLDALEQIKKKLPNGELESIKQSIFSLSQDQKSIREDLDYLKKRLFNPDDGVIVRINKNSDSISRFEEVYEEIPDLKNKINQIDDWRSGVNRALWIIFSSIIGIIIALIFSSINK